MVHEAAWDYAVSSYIPTLDCLYQLQLKKEQQVQPLLLNPCVVAVSDAPGRPLPQVDIEAGNIVKYLDSLGQKCNILRDSQEVLDKLPSHTVLHFAGHGDWAGTECLNGGLILRDGPLPLMKLMQLNMAKPKLAYLSACSTIRREGPESALDMLLCGFASVVMSVGYVSAMVNITCEVSHLIDSLLQSNSRCRGSKASGRVLPISEYRWKVGSA
jgi:CHAT domain-containing protein